MRIAISGTHGSGKSSLIAAFVSRHPAYAVHPEPAELLDEAEVDASPTSLMRQLELAIVLGQAEDGMRNWIAERCAMDFIAYVFALEELGRARVDRARRERIVRASESAMARLDLWAVLPLESRTFHSVSGDEDLELRAAMDRELMDLVDGWVGHPPVVELLGSNEERVERLERVLP